MFCEVKGCDRPSMPGVHHKKSRRRGGSDDPVNTMEVCFICHHAITTHDGEWTKEYRTHSWQEEGMTEADERT